MIRISDIILVLAVIAGAIWTFQIKHDAEQSNKRLTHLRSQIAAQENKIVLLQADRAIMTSPERLEVLAKTFEKELGLSDMRSTQIIKLSELPPKRVVEEEQSIQVKALPEGNSLDRLVVTGSVKPTRPKR